jgi:hypothetical protein
MSRIEPVPALLFAVVIGSTASPALAYIDPNIGGQLAQVLAPIVTMVIGLLAFARQWLKALFARISDRLRAVVSRVRG